MKTDETSLAIIRRRQSAARADRKRERGERPEEPPRNISHRDLSLAGVLAISEVFNSIYDGGAAAAPKIHSVVIIY